nr:hypothetical protein NCPCFENI_01123 [Cupriavidus sp.]
MTVSGDALQMTDGLELLAHEDLVGLPVLIAGKRGFIKGADHHPVFRVKHQDRTLVDLVMQSRDAHHSGQTQAAGENRRVGGSTAAIGGKPREGMLPQYQHIGRGDVPGHENPGRLAGVRGLFFKERCQAVCALHGLENSVDELLHIGLTFAQIGVFNLVKLQGDSL